MDQHRTRIVVGEGQTLRKGLLRFVLEGEGFDVVAEAGSSAELARMVAVHEPDVVVLDDGIGATAVQMARELAPRAKVILVWPGAVVPIGGDARVEPSEVLKELGGAVQRVTVRPAAATEGFKKPAWVDRIRKDPATLRDLLDKSGGLPRRPSVTELQRRGQRLHPVGRPDDASPPGEERERTPEPPAVPEPDEPDRPAAPVVILPVPGAGPGEGEPILVVDTADAGREGDDTAAATDEAEAEAVQTAASPPDARAPGPADEDEQEHRGAAVIALPTAAAAEAASTGSAGRDDDATEWNRRLGSIALGGAAVVGALVLALSLGGSRVPTDVLAADEPFPVGADAPQPSADDSGIVGLDGNAGPLPIAPTLSPAPPIPFGGPGTTPERDSEPPDTPTTTEPPATEPPPTGEPEPPGPPGGNGALPGASGRNRHGGPPGITGKAPDTPAAGHGPDGPGNGNGNGVGNGNAGGNNGVGNGNAGGNNAGGNGNGNGPPQDRPGQGRGGGAERAGAGHAHKR
jgi:hypothetical protein